MHILVYDGVRITYCNEVSYDTYSVVYVCMCTYMTSYEQYIALTAAVYACISSSYMHILTQWWGERMSVYARLASMCMYFYQKYMHIHQAVSERISNSISGSIFVCISNSISCCIFRAHTHGHSAVTVASHSPAPARGLCPFAARSLWQVKAKFVARQRKRRQIATFNQIMSVQLNSGSQWRPVLEHSCWSAMTILVGGRSLGNRGAATFTTAGNAISGFLEPTAHHNPSTERKQLQNY
jgi:hypothetical protein